MVVIKKALDKGMIGLASPDTKKNGGLGKGKRKDGRTSFFFLLHNQSVSNAAPDAAASMTDG